MDGPAKKEKTDPFFTEDEEDDDDDYLDEAAVDAAKPADEDDGGSLRQRRRGRPTFRTTSKVHLGGRVSHHQRQQQKSSEEYSQLVTADRRDLSPSEVVRQYLAKADEQIDHVIERIVHNVQEQADFAAQKSSEMVHASSRMVQTVVHNVHEKAEVAALKSSAMVQSAVQKLRDWNACHFEMLPNWMKDNEHLHFGHRPELPSFAECFKSIFRIHTETGNIWTHMIGFFAFLVVTIVFYVKPFCDNCHRDIGSSEKLIFLCFFVAALICLLCSTLFHTVSCHSESVSNLFSRLDYFGIAVLIVGSAITWLYYGFYCEFYTKITYTVAIAILGAVTAIITLSEKFNLPDYRAHRAILFVCLGLICALPIVHFVLLHGVSRSISFGALYHLVTMGGLYILGATLYAMRIPERFLPGKCDIWFQSHQLFHLLVVVAAFIHYHGVIEMAKLRLQHEPACPPTPSPAVI